MGRIQESLLAQPLVDPLAVVADEAEGDEQLDAPAVEQAGEAAPDVGERSGAAS